eukprot:1462793-Amphidinium_carterae.1
MLRNESVAADSCSHVERDSKESCCMRLLLEVYVQTPPVQAQRCSGNSMRLSCDSRFRSGEDSSEECDHE